METNISYNASSQTTAQVLPPSARLGSIVSLWDRQSRNWQNFGELGKKQKSQHTKTLEKYGVLSDKSPDDRRAPYLFGRTLSVGGVDFIQGGGMREIAGKRGSGGIGLERLGNGTPVLWCGDADGKRGSVITPIQQSSLKSKQTADTVNKCFADTAYCITNCFQCIFDDLTCFLRDLDNCFAYF